jgi:GMP synthase-like glutamine amidotransferase
MSTPAKNKRVLMLAHDPDADRVQRHPGHLAALLTEAAYETVLVSPMLGEQLPDPAGFDLIVVLGSISSAYDDAPWILRESELLRAADAAGVPIYGICFGAQLLAHTFGGSVKKGAAPELGVLTIESDVPDLIPAGPWWEAHYDVITPPPGATVLARTSLAVQAFAWKNHVGVQFHPEANADEIRAWRDVMRAEGSLSETRARSIEAEATSIANDEAAFKGRCRLLLDSVLSGAITKKVAA